MTMLAELSSARVPCTDSTARPIILREGISWSGGVRKSALRLELMFENPSPQPTVATTARVEVAPFGAFLPWSPLARVVVPGLPPGGRRLVTATAAGDAPDPRGPLGFSGVARLLRDALTSRSVHFVGNLNVYVTRRAPVERHMQRAVGLKPAHKNLALFCVGDGRPDAYTLHIGELEPGWEMELVELDWGVPARFASQMIALCITPRERADSGRASVVVERGSTGERVPVEFELEAKASAKCYFF